MTETTTVGKTIECSSTTDGPGQLASVINAEIETLAHRIYFSQSCGQPVDPKVLANKKKLEDWLSLLQISADRNKAAATLSTFVDPSSATASGSKTNAANSKKAPRLSAGPTGTSTGAQGMQAIIAELEKAKHQLAVKTQELAEANAQLESKDADLAFERSRVSRFAQAADDAEEMLVLEEEENYELVQENNSLRTELDALNDEVEELKERAIADVEEFTAALALKADKKDLEALEKKYDVRIEEVKAQVEELRQMYQEREAMMSQMLKAEISRVSELEAAVESLNEQLEGCTAANVQLTDNKKLRKELDQLPQDPEAHKKASGPLKSILKASTCGKKAPAGFDNRTAQEHEIPNQKPGAEHVPTHMSRPLKAEKVKEYGCCRLCRKDSLNPVVQFEDGNSLGSTPEPKKTSALQNWLISESVEPLYLYDSDSDSTSGSFDSTPECVFDGNSS